MTDFIAIKRKRGNTSRIVFHCTDDTGDVDVSLFSEFVLSVNPYQYPETNKDTLEVMNGYVVDGPTGRIGFTPTGEINMGEYFYDANFLDDNGGTLTFAEGTYDVTQGVTKA